jgi:hypothetical protein
MQMGVSVDLFLATRSGTAPKFPLIRNGIEQPKNKLFRTYQWAHKISDGLDLVKEVNDDMHQMMEYASQLTDIVDVSYHDSSTSYVTILCIARSEIQHFLLAYPTGQYGVEAFEANALYSKLALTELVRLAACVYSDMVLFPLPWRTGVKLRLAERMRSIWESSHVGFPEKHYTSLHVWLLWFGALAGFRSHHQDFFECELRSVLEVYYGAEWGCVTFETIREFLSGFLWWDPVYEMPGKMLWSRIRGMAAERMSGNVIPLTFNMKYHQ